jgi:phospholipid/cholesterol/gamma-HCH transport system ATP-binding protein
MEGAGKSVLLKLLIGLLDPDAGQVYLWDEPVAGLGEEGWLRHRRRMGLVFQSGALFDSMTVEENVAYPLQSRGGLGPDEIRARVEEILGWVDLAAAGVKSPAELSGGMRKRVALARTMVAHPELVLYDEPTTGLDPATARRISILMRDMGRRLASASIVVTHDVTSALVVARRWAFLASGRILAEGSPEELLTSTVPELQEFFIPWTSLMDSSRLKL